MSNVNNRYFGTEHGSEVEMTPTALKISGGSESPISISIDDNVGITIISPSKLSLNADTEIIMKTPKNININGQSQVNVLKAESEVGFSLENDLHVLGDNVRSIGTCCESYPDFDDEPQEGIMPEPVVEKEDKGFNWGKLAKNVLAGLAAVAVVTVAAVAVVASCGAISGTAAVVSMALSDIVRGEVSDIKDYITTI